METEGVLCAVVSSACLAEDRASAKLDFNAAGPPRLRLDIVRAHTCSPHM